MAELEPMHVCHIIYDLADQEQNRQVLHNITHTSKDIFEHTLIILTQNKRTTFPLPANTRFLLLDNGSRSFFSILADCKRALKVLQPDICHSYGTNTAFIPFFAAKSTSSLKIHSLLNGTNINHTWYHDYFYKIANRWIDKFTTPCKNTHAWLTDHVNIAPEKIILLRPALDIQIYRTPLHAIASNSTNIGTLEIKEDQFIIGLNVDHSPEKNVRAFINHYLTARNKSRILNEHAILVLLGIPANLPNLRKILRDALPEKSYVFIGHLPHNQTVLSRLDAFISLNTLVNPKQLELEAMAMGIPVIAPKTITNNFAAEITEADLNIAYQLIALFTNPHKRLRLGRASRDYINHYHNVETYRRKLHQLYINKENGQSHLMVDLVPHPVASNHKKT